MPTPTRTFRIDDDPYDAALAQADARGETLAAAVRRFLRNYAAGLDGDADTPDPIAHYEIVAGDERAQRALRGLLSRGVDPAVAVVSSDDLTIEYAARADADTVAIQRTALTTEYHSQWRSTLWQGDVVVMPYDQVPDLIGGLARCLT